MNRFVYLDNNATTKCDNSVVEVMLPYIKEQFANPSSLYSVGKEVKKQITKARKTIAKMLNAEKEEVIFTSGASESNVSAIMNAVRLFPNKKHIITTSVEHASIMETMKYLEDCGYDITYLSVDDKGRLNLNELKSSINENTLLIAVMMANNELGNIYPIKEIGAIAKENNILFHCDAVQAVGKTKIDVKDLNITTLSLSGHKIHAPKGIGALYVNKNIQYTALIFGHQESNRRGGTENVAGIVALGKACENILIEGYQDNNIKKLRDLMEYKITEKIKNVKIYGDTKNRLANTSSIAFKGVNAQELMFMLESQGVYVSTGSACNSESAEPSHVLTACSANLEEFSPIRISLSKHTTEEDIDYFVECLVKNVEKLKQ